MKFIYNTIRQFKHIQKTVAMVALKASNIDCRAPFQK